MSRNQNSRFALNPTNIDISRSRFSRNSDVKFTFNTGVLVPFYVDEVLPGDTHQIKTNKVVRLQTPITPFMDNLYLDTYYFFVPNRLVWNHWKQFMGENTASPWTPQVSYTVPQLITVSGNHSHPVLAGSALDYMGIPTDVPGISFSALPYRGYSLIWNEWFRDENLQYPLNFYLDDNSTLISQTNNSVLTGAFANTNYSGCCFAVSKFHDYFTSALPSPQKGPDVTLAMTGDIPVTSNGQAIIWEDPAGNVYSSAGDQSALLAGTGSTAPAGSLYNASNGYTTGFALGENSGVTADLSGISVATINQLRTAFQLQKLYEKDARGGSRYTEILKSHFGVTSPDSRLQRPEYLGGSRIPINVNQVIQNSESGTTPQGTAAAYSLTVDSHGDFIQSFTEHGFIIGVCCVRYDHSYQQGLEKFWSRQTRFDYFWPVFSNLGEQAIYNKELYAQGTNQDDEVFGYQEAWADYRYKPSRIAGEMRSNHATSLDVWHLGDEYASLPSLSAGWIVEDKANVDRVLQVTSSVSDQLLADFYVQNTTTRPMPMYSIPGLIDHH